MHHFLSLTANMTAEDWQQTMVGVENEYEATQRGDDPDDDPMTTIAREEDIVFRVLSDNIRRTRAAKALQEQLGIQSYRIVGRQETLELINLLDTL